jgi:hypothetical protein
MGDDSERGASGAELRRGNFSDARVSPETTQAKKSPTSSAGQYHHTETIWRIVVDAVSLSIRKFGRKMIS